MARNLRNNNWGNGGFFVFQDIITTVIGCMLMIILFLIISSHGGYAHSSSAGDSNPALTGKLKDKLAEISRLEDRLALSIKSTVTTLGKADGGVSLEAIQTLEAKIATLQTRLDQLNKEARDVDSQSNSPLQQAIAASSAVERQLSERLATIRSNLAEVELHMNEASNRVRELDASVSQALKDNQKIWVIPDQTRSTKKPIFAIVSGDKINWALYNQKAKVSESGISGLPSSLLDALRSYNPQDHYVILYFKPSGSQYFDTITKALKQQGYELGYDAIEEVTVLSFSTPGANP